MQGSAIKHGGIVLVNVFWLPGCCCCNCQQALPRVLTYKLLLLTTTLAGFAAFCQLSFAAVILVVQCLKFSSCIALATALCAAALRSVQVYCNLDERAFLSRQRSRTSCKNLSFAPQYRHMGDHGSIGNGGDTLWGNMSGHALLHSCQEDSDSCCSKTRALIHRSKFFQCFQSAI